MGLWKFFEVVGVGWCLSGLGVWVCSIFVGVWIYEFFGIIGVGRYWRELGFGFVGVCRELFKVVGVGWVLG